MFCKEAAGADPAGIIVSQAAGRRGYLRLLSHSQPPAPTRSSIFMGDSRPSIFITPKEF